MTLTYNSIPHFIWKVESSSPIAGEKKAEIATKMETIASYATDGVAKTEIFYDEFIVGAKITISVDNQMKTDAYNEAIRISTKGFSGFLAKILFFFKGIDKNAQEAVIENIAQKILYDKSKQLLNVLRYKLALAVSKSNLGSSFTELS